MSTGKELKMILSEKLERMLSTIKGEKLATLAGLKTKLEELTFYENLGQERQEKIRREFDIIESRINDTTQIAMINDQFRAFEDREYPVLVSRVQDWGESAHDNPHPDPKTTPEGDKPDPPPRKEKSQPIRVTLYANKIKPKYAKQLISDAEDVEQYVEAIKSALLTELEKGNTILV